jgi:hypothetical protein
VVFHDRSPTAGWLMRFITFGGKPLGRGGADAQG